jgi:hypothetical protein
MNSFATELCIRSADVIRLIHARGAYHQPFYDESMNSHRTIHRRTTRIVGRHDDDVMSEWLGRRTLNQRVVGSNLGEGTAWYL